MKRKGEIKDFQNWLLKSYSQNIKLRPMIVMLLGSGSFGMHIFSVAFGEKLDTFHTYLEGLGYNFACRIPYSFQINTSPYSFFKLLKIR